jgi:hypothetical protein
VNPATTAFYSTAATAIPVLLVAYLVEIAALVRRASLIVERVGSAAENLAMGALAAELGDRRYRRLAVALDTSIIRVFAGGVRGAVLGPLLAAVVGLPAVAEVCALVALSRGASTQALQLLTWLGLGVSVAILFVPALQLLTVIPGRQSATLVESGQPVKTERTGESSGPS